MVSDIYLSLSVWELTFKWHSPFAVDEGEIEIVGGRRIRVKPMFYTVFLRLSRSIVNFSLLEEISRSVIYTPKPLLEPQILGTRHPARCVKELTPILNPELDGGRVSRLPKFVYDCVSRPYLLSRQLIWLLCRRSPNCKISFKKVSPDQCTSRKMISVMPRRCEEASPDQVAFWSDLQIKGAYDVFSWPG